MASAPSPPPPGTREFQDNTNGFNEQNGSHISIRDSSNFANQVGLVQTNGSSIVALFNHVFVSNAMAVQSVATAVVYAVGNSFFGNNRSSTRMAAQSAQAGITEQSSISVANAGTIAKI
jgi:hypothetical protein